MRGALLGWSRRMVERGPYDSLRDVADDLRLKFRDTWGVPAHRRRTREMTLKVFFGGWRIACHRREAFDRLIMDVVLVHHNHLLLIQGRSSGALGTPGMN